MKHLLLTLFILTHLNSYTQTVPAHYNLSTGVRIEKLERYDTDKLLSYKKKKILIRPLPKLQDITAMENELY